MTLDAGNWNQITDVEQVGNNMNLSSGPANWLRCSSADGSCDGYLFTNKLGSMKFIPHRKKIPTGDCRPHAMRDNERIRVHTAYSSRVIPIPRAGTTGRT